MANKMADKKKPGSRNQSQEVEEKAQREEQRAASATREDGKKEAVKAVAAREERKKVVKQEVRSEKKSKNSFWARMRKNRFVRFMLEAFYELRKKVTWPTPVQARNMTIAVVAVSLIIGAFLFGIDYVFNKVYVWIVTGNWSW